MKKVHVEIELTEVLSIEMVAMFCRASYAFDRNPLPVLRRKLPMFEWAAAEWDHLSDLIEDDPFLVCAVREKYFVTAHLKDPGKEAYLDREKGQCWSKAYWRCAGTTNFGWTDDALTQELKDSGYWVGGFNVKR